MTTRGYWDMACWNGLSEAQQAMLIEAGVLFAGHWEPAGGTCDRGAEVAVETEYDAAPGPRFYCTTCAIEYLTSLRPPDPPSLAQPVRIDPHSVSHDGYVWIAGHWRKGSVE